MPAEKQSDKMILKILLRKSNYLIPKKFNWCSTFHGHGELYMGECKILSGSLATD